MYLPGLSKNIVSLEWGSHRSEYKLAEAITQEVDLGIEPETVVRTDPILGKRTLFYFPSPSVYQLRNVVFNPKTGRVFFNKHPLKESLTWAEGVEPVLDISSWFPSKSGEISSSTALRLSPNYYHFLVEDLPRLVLLRDAVGTKSIFSHRKISRFATDALAHYGFDFVPLSRPTLISNIFFCGPIAGSGVPSRLTVELLRSGKISVRQSEGEAKLKLYISRRDSSRSFSGEEKLESDLRALGYKSLLLQNLSFIEQMEYFSRAEVVVAPHGAGLANTVFMPAGAKVIEIMSRSYANPCFEILADAGGLSYSRIFLDSASRDQRQHVSRLLERIESHGG